MYLYCDLETYSDTPITCGAYRYAGQAQILLWAYAFGDGAVNLWDCTAQADMPGDLKAALADPAVTTVWHNGRNFDCVVLSQHGIDIPPHRIEDTMTQALAHGLPGALASLCDVLRVPLDLAKDKEGKALIQLFCKPRPKNSRLRRATRETHPEKWAQFKHYAVSDITAMREIHRLLPTVNREPELLLLDHRINRRGVCTDTDLARAAIAAVEKEQAVLAEQTQDMTDGDVDSATRRAKMLEHIEAAFGIRLPDLRAATVERWIEAPDTPQPLRDLLAVRLKASLTSVAKYQRLLACTCTDGRLRGTQQIYGASRTGRWAGRLVQLQNLPRPDMQQQHIDNGIAALKAGGADLIYDVMALTRSAIRGAIVSPSGCKLIVSDLSNIEGRVLAWLAGETWKIKAFADYDAGEGHDLYKLAYAKAFGIQPQEVTKDQRQVGKVMELALGYGGGVAAFSLFATAYGMDLNALADSALPVIPSAIQTQARQWYQVTEKHYGMTERQFITCDALKRLWRLAHPAVTALWQNLEQAAREALCTRAPVPCGRMTFFRDDFSLYLCLPSGRCVCYPRASYDLHNGISYEGVNQYNRKWQRLRTYAGKLAENATQAVARDILAASMLRLEQHGYPIVLTVHDEVICETPDRPHYSAAQVSSLLATAPAWAPGLPLNAAGFETRRYRKD